MAKAFKFIKIYFLNSHMYIKGGLYIYRYDSLSMNKHINLCISMKTYKVRSRNIS